MKTDTIFYKIKVSALLVLLAVFIVAPLRSHAQQDSDIGTCTTDSDTGEFTTTGVTFGNCKAEGGVWNGTASSPTTTGTKTGTGSTSPTCLPTGSADIPYSTTGDRSGTPCLPSSAPNPTSSTGISPTTGSTVNSATTTGGLVPACNSNCGFNDFMTLINNVVHFILFAMAIPIAAIMFAYAGFVLVTSGGSTEARGKAKRIFANVAIGLILAVAAWLIIELILKLVGFDGSWIGF